MDRKLNKSALFSKWEATGGGAILAELMGEGWANK